MRTVESVDIMIRSSRDVIRELVDYGVDFAKKDGEFDYTREGCHSKPRILFHEDITGEEITSKLLKAVRTRSNVTILEHVTMLDLVEKGLVTDQIVLTIGYDIENLTDADRRRQYYGEITVDRYGRKVPKHAHGTANLKRQTSSTHLITDAVMQLYDKIVHPKLLIKRIHRDRQSSGRGKPCRTDTENMNS